MGGEMVEAQVKIENGVLYIRNQATVISQLEEMGCEIYDVVFKRPFEFKSSDQLAYAFNEVFVKAMAGYRRQGTPCNNKDMARKKLALEEDVDFCEHIEVGGKDYRIPKSIATASKYELYEFIHLSIIFIETNLGIPVNLPEEFKKFTKNGKK